MNEKEVLVIAESYRSFGESYRRHIDEAAGSLEFAIERDYPASVIDHLAEQLSIQIQKIQGR